MKPSPNHAARQRRARGVTAVAFALMLSVLTGAAALALDYGILLTAKNSAQNAADAAALAGAYTFLNPAAAQPAAAQRDAEAVAASNTVLGQAVSLTATNISVDTANQRVTVTVPRTGANGIPAFFSALFGIVRFDVLANATAEASTSPSGSADLKPIFAPNTILSPLSPSQACSAGQLVVDASGKLTSYALGQLGTQVTIRPTSPGGSLAPSQFYSLDFGSGASTYRCALGSSLLSCGVSPAVAACGSAYATENGNMVGPTKQGISALVGANPDVWEAPGAYLHPDGSITDTSAALVAVPIWDNCNSSLGPGGGTVPIIGFTTWFVDGISSGGGSPGVVANFVGGCGCPNASGGGSVSNAPLGIPVRLVNP